MHSSGLVELEAVGAVALRRSFRAAAAELGMSRTALSSAVAGLERRLGVQLFHRTTRSVSLTEAGEQFIATVAPALAQIRGAMDAVNTHRATPTGTLRINSSLGAAHRVLAPIVLEFLRRYPEMRVVAPEGSRAKVQEVVPVDTVTPRFDDPNVRFVTVPGTRNREAALVVNTKKGTTLVLNDVVGNIRNSAGIGGWLLRRFGFAGKKAQIPGVVKMAMIKDKEALRAQLLEWAQIKSLKRILVSHGSPIEDNPRQVLRDLASSLG